MSPNVRAEQFQIPHSTRRARSRALIPPEIFDRREFARGIRDQLLGPTEAAPEAQAQQQQTMQQMAQAKAHADVTATQAKASADFALAKEIGTPSVGHIADVHQVYFGYVGATDPYTATQIQGRWCRRRPVQAANHLAALPAWGTREASVDQARANGLRHSAVQRINDVGWDCQAQRAGAAEQPGTV